MMHDEVISLDKQYIIGTYGRLPVVPDHASGATLYDVDGKKYIDFTSGIGVNSLGYSDKGLAKAVNDQFSRFQHICNYYYNDTACEVARELVNLSGLSKLFFANSGGEANEGAIKTARKYSFDKYGSERFKILSLVNSFHGRTITTLAATGQPHFHEYFMPFTEGFEYIPANDIAALTQKLDDTVCAVIAEPIQGEGGVNELDKDYVKQLRKLCDEKDVLLIFDEVQTGTGRTGSFFAYEYFGVKPDIVTLAKGLAGGIPVGTFICGEKCADTLSSGQHGSTFGSNPIAMAAAKEVISRVAQPDFLKDVSEKGDYFRSEIAGFNSPHIKAIRGRGLMIGIQIDAEPKKALVAACQSGLLVLTAGKDVIRLLPPLTITKEEIDCGLEILKGVFESL